MIACPACRRRVIAPRHILGASLDGGVTCPVCRRPARLDGVSRCAVGCTLALLLWIALLHGGLLFSGYLFLFSTLAILVGWRLLSAALLPLIALEKAPSVHFDRRQSLITLAVLIVLALIIDGLLSYRSEADKAYAGTADVGAAGVRAGLSSAPAADAARPAAA